ncbi:MAG: glycosyltransferase family 2 protein [Phormidium sp.]
MHFSIVITTYNRLDLLKRAIDSSLEQSSPCEVVVVDDCSTDGTQAYVNTLQEHLISQGDHRLIYHRNSSNSGHSKSMNIGVNLASGTWIKPLDDDDYLAPNCIQKLWRAIQSHPNAVICSSQADQVDPQGVVLHRTPRAGPGKAFVVPQEDIHYGMLLEIVPFGTPVQVAFRRTAFLDVGGWDSQFDGNCDDIDSWIKISTLGDAIFINDCLAYRTMWEGALNHKISLQKRLETNILMKKKIYACVNSRYQPSIPKLDHVIAYLRLHWAGVALKQKRFRDVFSILSFAIFCIPAWELLVRAVLFRQSPWLSRGGWFQEHPFRVPGQLLGKDINKSLGHQIQLESARYGLQLQQSWLEFKKRQWKTGWALGCHALIQLLKAPISHKLSSRWNIRKIPLHQQASANASLLEDIYDILQHKYESRIPDLKVLQHYLHLRWGWAALKQGKLWTGLKIVFPAVFDLQAWQTWLKIVRLQHQQQRHNSVRRQVIDTIHDPQDDSPAKS